MNETSGHPPPLPSENPPPGGDGWRMPAAEWINPEGQPMEDQDYPQWWQDARAATRDAGAPWPPTLAAIIIRAAARIPANYQLPPIVAGNAAAINPFIITIAPSGGGKTSGDAIARQLIPPDDELLDERADGIAPTSGAGIIRKYLKSKPGGGFEPADKRAAIFRYDEGARFEELIRRPANDTASVFREGWSGGTLTTAGGTTETDRFVRRGYYRMSLIVACQPDIPLPTLRDATTGMAQRMMAAAAHDTEDIRRLTEWLEAGQPDGDDYEERPDIEALPMEDLPLASARTAIGVEEPIRREIIRHHQARQIAAGYGNITSAAARAEADRLIAETIGGEQYGRIDHGEHTMLNRLITAAVFSALRDATSLRHPGITEHDWRLAYGWMAASAAALRHYDQRQRELKAEETRRHDYRRATTRGAETIGEVEATGELTDDLIAELADRAQAKYNGGFDLPPGRTAASEIWRMLPSRLRTKASAAAHKTGNEARQLWEEELTARQSPITAPQPEPDGNEPEPPPPNPPGRTEQ